MARHSPEVTDNSEALPRGQARLVIEDENVTIIIEGDHDEVQHRLHEELAAIDGVSTEEYEAELDDMEIPELDELTWNDVVDTDA